MGVIRSIGTRVAQRFLESSAKSVAKRGLDHLAAKAVTDEVLKELLAGCITEAEKITGKSIGQSPKHMGMTHASPKYKKGWYVFIENFEELTAAKSSKNNGNVRFNFRAVQYKDDPQPHLEALVWHPSHGNADEMKFIFVADSDSGREMFVQLMATAIHLSDLSAS